MLLRGMESQHVMGQNRMHLYKNKLRVCVYFNFEVALDTNYHRFYNNL